MVEISKPNSMQPKLNPLDVFIKNQVEYLREVWYSREPEKFKFAITISEAEKLANEEIVKNTLMWVKEQLQHTEITADGREALIRSASGKLGIVLREIIHLTEPQVNIVLTLGKERLALDFFEKARAFDPNISIDGIIQATRNLWIANSQQMLLGIPLELTSTLFAYSMLYPISDNFLDDPLVSKMEKIDFNQRFRMWLQGEPGEAQNHSEKQIQILISMIEAQFPRQEFPQIYETLLAIHRAQDKNMRIPSSSIPPYSIDLIGLSFEKGGTSVLTDGILTGKHLTKAQMELFFNFGAFTQLMDDHEDITPDLKDGSQTIFTESVRAGNLDHLMKRVFCFAQHILKGLDCFDDEKVLPLTKIANTVLNYILTAEILTNEKYYSREYIRSLEPHFPFRFKFIRKVTKKLKKNFSPEKLLTKFNPEINPQDSI